MARCTAVSGLLALLLVSCGGDQFTTEEREPQSHTGGAGSLGGSQAMNPPASGGEATGGVSTGGTDATGGSTGGEPTATGGTTQPPAPADVPCSPISCAESVIARYDDGAPRCFDVDPYAFAWGIVERVSVQGECFATLDGEPVEPSAVPWSEGTRLLVWNCGFELSCSEF